MKTIKVKSTSSNDKVTHSVIEKELDRLKKHERTIPQGECPVDIQVKEPR